MPTIHLRRPRYADIVATLALLIAMSGTAYAATVAANSVGTAQLKDGAVTNPKLAKLSVGTVKLRDGAVTGAKVGADTVSLRNLVGTDGKGTISFSLGANSCGILSLSVPGALPGQVGEFAYTGTGTIPSTVVFSPLLVTSAGHMTVRGCNVGSTPVSASGVGVRIVTFG